MTVAAPSLTQKVLAYVAGFNHNILQPGRSVLLKRVGIRVDVTENRFGTVEAPCR